MRHQLHDSPHSRGRWSLPGLILATACGLLSSGPLHADEPEDAEAHARETAGARVENGWLVHGRSVIWGYAQHNGWWRPGQRPNLTRESPGQVGPNRTEDLEELSDLVLAAINMAVGASQEHSQAEMKKITGGIHLPGLY